MKPHIEYIIKLTLCTFSSWSLLLKLSAMVIHTHSEQKAAATATTIERSKMECRNDNRWIIKTFYIALRYKVLYFCMKQREHIRIIQTVNIKVKFASHTNYLFYARKMYIWAAAFHSIVVY